MKTKVIYVCEYCGFESTNEKETLTHEVAHIGDGLTLREYEQWMDLKTLVIFARDNVYKLNEEQARQKQENATRDLLRFERAHGIINGGKP